jgi:predicted RNase H-like HicB family nuclease
MSEVLIRLQIEALPEGVYLATSEDLPGLLAQGRTLAETIEIAQDVARKLIESYQEHGDPLPSAIQQKAPKRIKLQIPLSVG